MNGSVLALSELLALAYLIFALGISVTCAGLYPLSRRRLSRWAPADRANWLLAFCIAPAGGALLLAALCLLPSLDVPSWSLVDHCAAHGSGHPHLCFAHLPKSAGTVPGTAALLTLAGLCAALALDLHRAVRLRNRLQSMIDPGGTGPGFESLQPLAATIGILRPRVFVSSVLRKQLSAEELAVVLRHEEAHVRRRDPLRRVLARLGCVLHLPATRRQLLMDLQLACEQACDEQTANRTGDRLLVARTLITVERLMAKTQVVLPAFAPAFGEAGITARVGALASDPVPAAPLWIPAAAFGVLATLIAAADDIHHTTETVLGLVAR